MGRSCTPSSCPRTLQPEPQPRGSAATLQKPVRLHDTSSPTQTLETALWFSASHPPTTNACLHQDLMGHSLREAPRGASRPQPGDRVLAGSLREETTVGRAPLPAAGTPCQGRPGCLSTPPALPLRGLTLLPAGAPLLFSSRVQLHLQPPSGALLEDKGHQARSCQL